jgi:hypothetical protein
MSSFPSLPSSIKDYTIDYSLSAQQNLERYIEQRLQKERKFMRRKILVVLDETFEGYATTAGFGASLLTLGG